MMNRIGSESPEPPEEPPLPPPFPLPPRPTPLRPAAPPRAVTSPSALLAVREEEAVRAVLMRRVAQAEPGAGQPAFNHLQSTILYPSKGAAPDRNRDPGLTIGPAHMLHAPEPRSAQATPSAGCL